MENMLLVASLVGTGAFGLTFIVLAITPVLRKPAETNTTKNPVTTESAIPTPKDLGEMAEKFKNSGPQATSATLTVFFFTAALMTGGVLDVSLDAGGGDARQAATE